MKISNKFSRLKEEEALIIVASKQAAIFYEISGGHMSKLDAFKIPRTRYSDNEGQFRSRSRGNLGGVSSSHEVEDEDVIREFIKEFKKRIKDIKSKASHIYLLAPDKTKNRIPRAFPVEWRGKLKATIAGNYYYRSEAFILEKIHGKSNI
jgi:hypothetical protein